MFEVMDILVTMIWSLPIIYMHQDITSTPQIFIINTLVKTNFEIIKICGIYLLLSQTENYLQESQNPENWR